MFSAYENRGKAAFCTGIISVGAAPGCMHASVKMEQLARILPATSAGKRIKSRR
jgi:hypothetical protein